MRVCCLVLVVGLIGCGSGSRARSEPPTARCDAALRSPLYDLKQNMVLGPAPTLAGLTVTGVRDDGFFAELDPSGLGCDPTLGVRYGGVFVFTSNQPKPAPDDVVDLEGGTVADFFGQVQIQRPSWTAVGRRAVRPHAFEIATLLGGGARSAYEGLLVEVSDAVVSDPAPAPGQEGQGELELEGGLRVDDFLGWSPPGLAAGDHISRLSGVLAWRFGHLQLGPRGPSDVDLEPASCNPTCDGRTCGPDPTCGQSCGTCTAGTCTALGTCSDDPNPAGHPVIVSLSFSRTTIDPNTPAEVTLRASHEDGLERLAGAVMEDPSLNLYGALTMVSPGVFAGTLRWADIDRLRPLTFGPEGADRTIRVTVTDNRGQRVTQDRVIHLQCPGAAQSACAGSCSDLAHDIEHCGQCNQSCTDWAEATGTWYDTSTLECSVGTCRAAFAFDTRAACATHCRDLGSTCGPSRSWTRCRNTRLSGFTGFNPPRVGEACATYDEGGTPAGIDGDCAWIPPEILPIEFHFANQSCACSSVL